MASLELVITKLRVCPIWVCQGMPLLPFPVPASILGYWDGNIQIQGRKSLADSIHVDNWINAFWTSFDAAVGAWAETAIVQAPVASIVATFFQRHCCSHARQAYMDHKLQKHKRSHVKHFRPYVERQIETTQILIYCFSFQKGKKETFIQEVWLPYLCAMLFVLLCILLRILLNQSKINPCSLGSWFQQQLVNCYWLVVISSLDLSPTNQLDRKLKAPEQGGSSWLSLLISIGRPPLIKFKQFPFKDSSYISILGQQIP